MAQCIERNEVAKLAFEMSHPSAYLLIAPDRETTKLLQDRPDMRDLAMRVQTIAQACFVQASVTVSAFIDPEDGASKLSVSVAHQMPFDQAYPAEAKFFGEAYAIDGLLDSVAICAYHRA